MASIGSTFFTYIDINNFDEKWYTCMYPGRLRIFVDVAKSMERCHKIRLSRERKLGFQINCEVTVYR